ncbi:MAG: replication restart helicase PriA [Planctomycetota bacterium]
MSAPESGPASTPESALGERVASAPRYARVAPPLPVSGLFTYAIPQALAGRVQPGCRVLVPFGARRLAAMCVGVDDEPPPRDFVVRELAGLLEEEPLAGADILQLGAWVATATGCSWGEALDAMLPAAVKSARQGRHVEEVVLAGDPRAAAAVVEQLQPKREKQARALRILADRGGVLPVRELMSLAHVSRSPIESLQRAGLLSLRTGAALADPLAGAPVPRTAALELTPQQRLVCERIVSLSRAGVGRTVLLHGVTGSGKTEVYLQALDAVVAAGRQGIVLVPEISLTPQTVRRFRERFARVAVLHSRLTEAERAAQWRRIRRGEADVVVGARSAIFAPVPSLGLIVVDEEHETSFKQQSVPRYHAREVAIERARLSGAITVLGTATPSLESWHRAQHGEYELLELPERVAGGSAPQIVMVDLTMESRRHGFSYLSDPLKAAIEDALARGGQVLLFLNRRGWAGTLLCRSCRQVVRCKHCDVSLTLHRRIRRALCHYCGHEEPQPAICAACGGPLALLGYGTEKVEDEVRQGFLQASVARMDSDTMSGRGSHERVLADFAAGRTQVLIGTQMIAKGLDFPNVTLVGVICADSALFLPDYRAAERTFQLLAQVVGRTGRGPRGGRVVVQAYDPRHFAIRLGVTQDMAGFAALELPLRQEVGYPPFQRLVRVIAQSRLLDSARSRLDALARAVRGEEPSAPALEGVLVMGPAPAPIPRLNDQHRFHIVCKCATDGAVSALLGRLSGLVAPKRNVRLLVDVDPVAML